MKKLIPAIIFSLALFVFTAKTFANSENTIIYYFGRGCSHCTIVNGFLEDNEYYSKYNIEKREVYFDRENAVLFNKDLDNLEFPIDRRGVPTVIAGEQVLVGDKPIIDFF